jgi:hypothetical protein
MEHKEHWIFYLKLKKNLSEEFLYIDREFKEKNKSLIPIGLKGLLNGIKNYKSIHVMVVIRNYQELRYFETKVKKIMKYVLRTEKVHLYVASSFNSVNDVTVMKKNHYNFIKLPVSTEYLCGSISRSIDIKETHVDTWPGGSQPRMRLGS